MMASHEIILTKSSSNPQDYLLADADTSKLTYPDLPEDQRMIAQYPPDKILGQPRTFTLPDGSQVEISFRRYVEGPEDDAAFQRLDAECRQGKAGLETKFFLTEGWSSFQGDSHCIVAYPVGNPQEIIATCRGFRKWVYLNGIPVPMSYEFLLRLAPKYRGAGIAEMTSRLLLNDDRISGCRYILGYVVEDNVKSLNVQKKILAGREDTLMTEFKKWYVSGYSPKELIEKINTHTLSSQTSQWKIYRSNDLKEQVDHTKRSFASAQLLPCDLSNIFRSKLSEGTYFVKEGETDLASFSVWNSGAVRSSRLPGMKDFLDRPCIFYNVWMNPSIAQQKTCDALSLLIKTVSQHLDTTNSHGFIYLFLLNDHPLAPFFQESAKFFISWKARLWYWDALFKHDPSTGCDLAFDPRDALQ